MLNHDLSFRLLLGLDHKGTESSKFNHVFNVLHQRKTKTVHCAVSSHDQYQRNGFAADMLALGVVQGHLKWRGSIDHVLLSIGLTL